ncbi:MAG: bifunctional folylpolyglutamate synthase/dihydrofolate synthase [Verrucomicrobiaceae bacterium]|nr:bifunctional folylpolyglutamate synthase/dihydrofolate synthase [Verrucomicrobiaceae bacterium]
MPHSLSFSDDAAALTWLYSTQMYGVKLGLENVQRLLSAMELPGQEQRFIHVAGTNGKGSTCAFAHQLLVAAGLTAGIFTSPHLIRFNERIRDGERMITGTEIAAGLSRIRAIISLWDPHPTFFEITLALALDWFRSREVQWVVLETGLGGRLDATNAILPKCSVITSIGLDHTEILGDTLEKIASEKAGIIKAGVPVVSSPQEESVMDVIQKTAGEKVADLRVIDQPWQKSIPALAGVHQRWNAALALAAVRAAGVDISDTLAEHAFAQTVWPARFQRLGAGGQWIIDGAHNPASAQALVATWREVFGTAKPQILLGVVHGKDLTGVLEALSPICAQWHVAPFQSPRAMPTEDLAKVLGATGIPVQLHRSLTAGLNAAASADAAQPALVAGSLFLAGEALDLLSGRGGFEPSWQ